jgi:hypothetical protein
MYDGIHYDAMAESKGNQVTSARAHSFSPCAKKRFRVGYAVINVSCAIICSRLSSHTMLSQEVCMFPIEDEEALEACVSIVSKLHQAKQFTDTSAFALKCLVCGKGLTGAQVCTTSLELNVFKSAHATCRFLLTYGLFEDR